VVVYMYYSISDETSSGSAVAAKGTAASKLVSSFVGL
jgi:hypothetical protein